ncbi:MAG TPA: PAS domain-containing protein, partial [Candidatus Limnocylindrales bacterium]
MSRAIITSVRDRRTRPTSTGLSLRRTALLDATAIEAAPVGVFQTDADGAGVYVNDRWCEYAAMTRQEAMGEGWLRAVHPDDLERVRDEWAASVADGRDFELEFRFTQPDGQTLWVTGTATAVNDARGAVSGYIGTVTNITAAVAARMALSDERRFVDTVLDIAGSLVCVFDAEGRFLRFNRAC